MIAHANDEPNLNFNFWFCAAFCYIPFYATGRFPVQCSNTFFIRSNHV